MSNKYPQQTPTISVVMSVYNGEKYLSTAIDSILQQTWRDFEFIIIDDASFDTSPDILKEYKGKDERIRLINNKLNLGLGASLQKVIQAARGEFIARMDADDISLPDRFEKQIDYLIKHPEILVLGGEASFINQDINQGSRLPKDPDLMRWNMLLGNGLILVHGSVMFRRLFFEKFGGYSDLRAAQDFELWTRTFCAKPLPIANLDEIIYLLRVHDNSTTRAMSGLQEEIAINIRLKKIEEFLGRPVPRNVVMAYRHPGDHYGDIHECIVNWVNIFIQFINHFDLSKAIIEPIKSELFYEIDKYSTFKLKIHQKRIKTPFIQLLPQIPILVFLDLLLYKIRQTINSF